MHTYAAKVQAQSLKDSRVEEPKARGPDSTTPPRPNPESSTKAWREKKKDCRRHDQQQRQQEGSTPATGVKVAEPGEFHPRKNQKNRNRSSWTARDPSQVKCYNCQKIDHYAHKCPEPPKN